jgi:hypothetical protein
LGRGAWKLGRLSGGVGSGPDKISLDDWSFFIAVKAMEIGYEGRFGSWWNGGIEVIYSHTSVFLKK